MNNKSYIEPFQWIVRVIINAVSKFWWDDCFSRASSLAYTSLFAIVPGAALVFGLFSGFNIDSNFVDEKFGSLLANLLPPNEDELLSNLKDQLLIYLKQLSDVVRALGLLSLPVLVFSGIALVNTIESALNVVWRVSSQRSIMSKVINFWAVITLGPLFVLLSFYWYARFTASTTVDPSAVPFLFSLLDIFVPVLCITMALTLMFYKLTAARVSLSDAGLGALFSAMLFEFLKRGFAYYISLSTTYKSFYGVLVSLPLFLFWLYLVWAVVLLGAQIAYQAGSISVLKGLKKYASELGEIGGILGLRILMVIGARFQKGEALPTEGEIAIETGSDPVLVRTCLGILCEGGIITASDPESHGRALRIPPDKLTVSDVVISFRSKLHRESKGKKEMEIHQDMKFLEVLKATSKICDPKVSASKWTLADLLYALNKVEGHSSR